MKLSELSVESDPILRIADVQYQTGLSKSQIYALIKKGEFPSQISLGVRASGWLLSEINQWKKKRIRISRGNPADCLEEDKAQGGDSDG